MPDAIFEAMSLTSGYRGVTVLKGVTFEMRHEIFAILGANGAGKSTLMKTIARVLPLTAGRMRFKGGDISSIAPHELAIAGMAYVPQEQNIFPDLTVGENLSIGGLSVNGHRSNSSRRSRVDKILELFPALRERINQKAATLSGGEAQMTALGRALMQEPDLILLDEPTAGLAPKYVDNFFARIIEIHKTRNVSIMLAEQNATKALEIADRVMLLSLGKIFLIDETRNVDPETLKQGYEII